MKVFTYLDFCPVWFRLFVLNGGYFPKEQNIIIIEFIAKLKHQKTWPITLPFLELDMILEWAVEWNRLKDVIRMNNSLKFHPLLKVDPLTHIISRSNKFFNFCYFGCSSGRKREDIKLRQVNVPKIKLSIRFVMRSELYICSVLLVKATCISRTFSKEPPLNISNACIS